MASNPKTVPLNWTFAIECVDCKTEFTVESVNPSVDRLERGKRIVMLTIPNECPKCRNLRVVPKENT